MSRASESLFGSIMHQVSGGTMLTLVLPISADIVSAMAVAFQKIRRIKPRNVFSSVLFIYFHHLEFDPDTWNSNVPANAVVPALHPE